MSHFDLVSQTDHYASFYTGPAEWVRAVRYDARYRARRLQDCLAQHAPLPPSPRVLDVGFGFGDQLLAFPKDAHLVGVDISASAVERAARDPRFDAFASAHFQRVPEGDPDALPRGPFDVVLCSHVLEHVPDDAAFLRALRQRLAPGGTLAVYVPIEPPDRSRLHVRVYTLQTLTERVRGAELRPLHVEGSFFAERALFGELEHLAGRQGKVARRAVQAVRHGGLSLLPPRVFEWVDRAFYRLGAEAGQGLVLAGR